MISRLLFVGLVAAPLFCVSALAQQSPPTDVPPPAPMAPLPMPAAAPPIPDNGAPMAMPPGCPPASVLPRHRAVAYGGYVVEAAAVPGCNGAPGLPNPACPVDPNKPGGARDRPCAAKPKES